MTCRKKSIEITNGYVSAFNMRDIGQIISLFDPAVVSSQQKKEGVSIGPSAIQRRIKAIWKMAERRSAEVAAVCGLIDFNDRRTLPCVTLIIDKVPFSLILCEANKDRKAHLHTEITNLDVVANVRFCCSHMQMKNAVDKSCPLTCYERRKLNLLGGENER